MGKEKEKGETEVFKDVPQQNWAWSDGWHCTTWLLSFFQGEAAGESIKEKLNVYVSR